MTTTLTPEAQAAWEKLARHPKMKALLLQRCNFAPHKTKGGRCDYCGLTDWMAVAPSLEVLLAAMARAAVHLTLNVSRHRTGSGQWWWDAETSTGQEIVEPIVFITHPAAILAAATVAALMAVES